MTKRSVRSVVDRLAKNLPTVAKGVRVCFMSGVSTAQWTGPGFRRLRTRGRMFLLIRVRDAMRSAQRSRMCERLLCTLCVYECVRPTDSRVDRPARAVPTGIVSVRCCCLASSTALSASVVALGAGTLWP